MASAHDQRRPRVALSGFDGPPEVVSQAPLHGGLLGVIPGPDRPDYVAILLERPVYLLPPPGLDLARVEPGNIVRDGERMSIRVNAVVVCASLSGQQISPGCQNLRVNVAAVVDNTALGDHLLDVAKVHLLGQGLLSHVLPAPSASGLS